MLGGMGRGGGKGKVSEGPAGGEMSGGLGHWGKNEGLVGGRRRRGEGPIKERGFYQGGGIGAGWGDGRKECLIESAVESESDENKKTHVALTACQGEGTVLGEKSLIKERQGELFIKGEWIGSKDHWI